MARRKRRRSGRATTMPKRGWRIANTNSLLLQWYSGGAEATFLSYRIKWGAAVNTLQSCSPTRQPTTDKTTRIRFMECYLQSWLSFVPFFFCFVFLFFILLLSKCTTRTTYIVEWMYDARVCVCVQRSAACQWWKRPAESKGKGVKWQLNEGQNYVVQAPHEYTQNGATEQTECEMPRMPFCCSHSPSIYTSYVLSAAVVTAKPKCEIKPCHRTFRMAGGL